MRRSPATIAARLFGALSALGLLSASAAAACDGSKESLGVSRVIQIDTSTGALFGDVSKYTKEESFLAENEVVLTFDDGPMPNITGPILDALDRYCTKATFFSIGQMAFAYPQVAKDIVARGHTLGAHTWSHPNNLARLSLDKAKDQIDRGFAAVAMAAGQPIAPFFRFPGLNDSDPLLAHLQTQGIAAFTVDVISNDSFIANPSTLLERVKRQTAARKGGILLFHDIKKSTAKALPGILAWLKANNYKVVHLVPKAPLPTSTAFDADLAPKLAKTLKPLPANALPEAVAAELPGTETTAAADATVTLLAPPARERLAAVTPTEPPATPRASGRSKRKSVDGEEAPLPRPARKKRKSQQAGLFDF